VAHDNVVFLSHSFTLFFKDCFSGPNAVPALRDALAKVKTVVHFIRDRQKPLAICRSHAEKEVILPGETRSRGLAMVVRF
jgi:hypothetical protein